MRWDSLFDDLEGQLEHELAAEDHDLRAEEERLRLGRLSLRDRIVAVHEADGQSGAGIRLFLLGNAVMNVRPATFGRDWFSATVLDESSQASQVIVPMAAISSVAFTRAQALASLSATPSELSQTSLPARLTLSFVLRDLCRRRAGVTIQTLAAGLLHGTIDRVGRDHVDLAMHERGEARRESGVEQFRAVPLGQVAVIRLG